MKGNRPITVPICDSKEINMISYKIFISGENTEFLDTVLHEMNMIITDRNVSMEPMPQDSDSLADGSMIVFNQRDVFPGFIKKRATEADVPLVFLQKDAPHRHSFSIEEPFFFAAVETSARAVAEFMSLIILFKNKLDSIKGTDDIRERLDLLDEIIVDFGKTLNSKLSTIIGYADFALSESDTEEMQRALEVALEAGIDTAQLLQNMLLSVKAIVRQTETQEKRWAA